MKIKELHCEEKVNNLLYIVDLGENSERNRCGAAENPQENYQPGEENNNLRRFGLARGQRLSSFIG